MAKQIEGVYDSLMDAAKKEFLLRGYNGASLRSIAAEAGTSTNSIYVRFKDKEGLFRAIVKPAADGLIERFLAVQESFHGFDVARQKEEVGVYSANEMLKLVQEVAPTLFKKAGPSCVSGPCPEGKMSCGKAELMRKTYLSEAK